MRVRYIGGATLLAAALATPLSLAAISGADAATCDPVQTKPVYRGKVPSPKDVLGFELGDRQATSAESDRYLEKVAAKSDRVISGTLAKTAEGRPLKYAIVGRPDRLTKKGLTRVQTEAFLLRNPTTPAKLAQFLAGNAVPILWVSANVHGNEPSGTDAALKVLRDLSDRSDCAAERIVDNALVVVLPIQNPDGRENNVRRNAYGFDMNRDWFARTQPETDGKLKMLAKYPPVLYIDAHEMGGTSYFFPPNADPIYHDIPEPTVNWINDLYGAPMAAEFKRQGIDFFNRDTYDLFYMGYGDTVPVTGFLAAGMTFEKGGESPYPERTKEQYLTQWVSLSSAITNKKRILTEWHQMSVDAVKQGKAGELEPNKIYNPPNEVISQVPDRKVRSYFLLDDPAKKAETHTIVRRLQQMGVSVSRLSKPLTVKDFKAYGRPVAKTTLPAGTFYIPMAQGQKHWIQAMLNEDSYTPFPYFYDVTAWSMPLLGNVRGGSSGAALKPATRQLTLLSEPAAPSRTKAPKIGVLQLSATSTTSIQSTGWLRSRLDRDWKLPYKLLTPADVAAGKLAGIKVLLAPDGPAESAYGTLGDDGRAALRKWAQGGGRYVGWTGGTELAARLGLTTATLKAASSNVPGSLLRVKVDAKSPLAKGVGATDWVFYQSEFLMTAGRSRTPVAYPAADSPDWFVSGFQEGAAELGGTAAVVDEPVGQGRTVLFSADPNFRSYTDGTAKLLFNAILGPNPASTPSLTARDEAHEEAARAADALPSLESPIRISVHSADARRTARVLTSLGANWIERRSGDVVNYVIDNPRGLPTDHHPYARKLAGLFKQAGITPVAVTLP